MLTESMIEDIQKIMNKKYGLKNNILKCMEQLSKLNLK